MIAHSRETGAFLRSALLASALTGAIFVGLVSQLDATLTLFFLIGLAVVALVISFPSVGLLLTVAVVPMERLGRLTSDESMHTISLMRIVGLIALASLLVHTFIRRRQLRFPFPFVLYSIYAGFAFLSIVNTEHLLGTVRALGAILGNLLFFFLLVNLVRSWKTAQMAVVVWLSATVLVGVYTMYDWYWGESVEVARIGETEARFSTVMQDPSEWERLGLVRRAVGPTSSAAVYGINLVMTLPFFFFFLRRAVGRGVRLGLYGGLIIVVYNILLTNTRAALLLLLVIVAMSVARRLIELTPRRLAAIALLVAVMGAAAPEALIRRVFDPNRYRVSEAGTFQIRMQFWRAGAHIARQHWLTGFGVGNQATIPKYIKVEGPEQTTVHNEFLMTLIEVGIFGWLAFFTFVGIVFRYSVEAARLFRRSLAAPDMYWFMVACQITMLGVLVYGLQVDVFHFPLKGWWLVAGLSCVLYRLARTGVREASRAPNLASVV